MRNSSLLCDRNSEEWADSIAHLPLQWILSQMLWLGRIDLDVHIIPVVAQFVCVSANQRAFALQL